MTEQTKPTKLFALMIGIDDYRAVPKLRGCVRDVEELKALLINRFKVPAANIVTLTNAQATRQGIIDAFKKNLIENPAIQSGDQILFQYSGHGSQMTSKDPLEPDGLDETLVAYDSRTRLPGDGYIYDLPDKTLAALLEQLAKVKGNNITIILDCCHSGSGTREIKLNTRRAPIDLTPAPDDLDADIRNQTGTRQADRKPSPSGWDDTLSNHVLLAGCRDAEESNEHRVSANYVQGAMTYFLLQALSNLAPNSTYSDVHAQVAANVNSRYRDQMPQCEGQRQRAVFGGVTLQRDPFMLVQSANGATVTLNAGLIHGLREKTVLAIYPESIKTVADLKPNLEPLAKVEVVTTSATSAQAKVISGAKTLAPNMRAVITEQQFDKRAVSLSGDKDKALRSAITESPYLTLSDQATDLNVLVEKNSYVIQDGQAKALTLPLNNVPDVVTALGNIARYQRLLTLQNDNAESQLANALKLKIRRLQAGKAPNEMDVVPTKAGGDLVIDYSPELVKAKQCDFIVEIVNTSDQPIYPHLFYLDAEFGIKTYYPVGGQEEAIQPNKSLFVMRGNGGRNLLLGLPEQPRWDWANEYLKVIGTLQPSDLSTLDQKGLTVPPSRSASRSALGALLNTALEGSRHPRDEGDESDWAATILPVRIVRKTTKRDLPPDAQDVPVLDDTLTLKKPKDMTGSIAVVPVEVGKRGGDDDGVRPPPALEAEPEFFQLLGGPSNSRDVGASGAAIELDVDEATRAAISESNPLIFERHGTRSADEDGQEIVVVAYDGEDYLVVGNSTSSDPNTIAVKVLPKPAVSTRGIGKTIQLFFYKKLGRYSPELGLHYATLENGMARYSTVDASVFKPGQSVAVMVHGFNSESKWMAQYLWAWLHDSLKQYDHCVTFDYETFGTGSSANGKTLAEALSQQCGFNADDGLTVHLFAHSMGCLVSRCAVELHGAAAYVDKVVLAGPPNHGTTLATLGKGVLYLASLGLNLAGKGLPITLLRKSVDELSKQAAGVADLFVDSALTVELNRLAEPSNVPYLVLVGLNAPDPTQQSTAARLAHKLLDTALDQVFGEQNDGVIGKHSLEGVRNGTYQKQTTQALNCDHFQYYWDAGGMKAVEEFVVQKP